MKFYRYTAHHYGSMDEFENVTSTYSRLECAEYSLIKETPKGYWIGYHKFSKRWVSKTARKRYAYPTKEQALESYVARTTRRIAILKSQIKECEETLYEAQRMANPPERIDAIANTFQSVMRRNDLGLKIYDEATTQTE